VYSDTISLLKKLYSLQDFNDNKLHKIIVLNFVNKFLFLNEFYFSK